MKSVSGLLEHCKTAVKNNVQYVYGAKMQVLTREQIQKLQTTYGKSYVWDSDLSKAGKLCCDCSGLISSYTGVLRSSATYKSTAKATATIAQVKANWGKYVGWAFWLSGHIGVVSDTEGYYYAMDGSARNMVHLPITKQSWVCAVKLCDIDYSGSVSTNKTSTSTTSTTSATSSKATFSVGDTVDFKGGYHYTSSDKDAEGHTCKDGKAVITKIKYGAAHPYHLKAVEGGGSTVYGWVNGTNIAKA
jgi:hypothetical protein